MNDKQDSKENDANLLEYAFRDVKPLPGRKIRTFNSKRAKLVKVRRLGQNRSFNSQKLLTASKHLPEIQHGESANVDKQTARRLKQGKLEIEARLDLHGLKQLKAETTLKNFIRSAHSNGKRCVLVITGKGAQSQGGGVLKRMVPKWLNDPINRANILCFDYAKPGDGGSGALYVLLRRKRS